MSKTTVLLATALVAITLGAGSAQAQAWSAEQTAVWTVVSSTWERDLKKDSGWMQDATHASVSAWGMTNPAPRNRDSLVRWARHSNELSTMLIYELSPHAIVVAGDTALAHYHYTTASRNAEGKVENTIGRCSDTLVKSGGRWVFLGWSCSDEPKK